MKSAPGDRPGPSNPSARTPPRNTIGNLPVCASTRVALPDGDACYCPGVFGPTGAQQLFARLRTDIAWQEEHVVIFGQRRKVPRLVAWYGDPGASYVYSGVRHEPLAWIPPLAEIRERVEGLTGHAFNSVLANLYRDGNDGMGWHADDEPELGPNPVIASVSFGATRRFRMRHRRRRDLAIDLDLEHGSLLVMAGATQHHWVHAVPKTRRPVGERINLTFRRILSVPA
jgi:alkylated DNA repair dioxygenase AlkB